MSGTAAAFGAGTNKQDEVNRAYIRGLGKQPLEKVFGLAHEFLNENRDADNWLLHIEPFDPA